MFNFDVKSLNDGHAAARIVRAVIAVDPQASVCVSLATRGVAVRSTALAAHELLGALSSAGISAELVEPRSLGAHAALSEFAAFAAPTTPVASTVTAESVRRITSMTAGRTSGGTSRRIPFEPDGTEFDSSDA